MKIFPQDNIVGQFNIPADKSITHRALILASIATGKSVIENPLMCADTKSTLSCLKKLGVKYKYKDNNIEIKGVEQFISNQKLDCDNSGTTMRLLCGMLAGTDVKTVLHGDKSLNSRPMVRIKAPLEEMGATVALTDYKHAPILVEGGVSRGINYHMPVDSAQVKSAILLCGLQAHVSVTIEENNITRNHTEILIKHMGGNIGYDDKTKSIKLADSTLKGGKITIPGDISTASYFIALGVLLGKVTVKNIGINPTRMGFITVLKRMGANIQILNERVWCGEKVADIIATKSQLKATHVLENEIPLLIDELPILAVIMGLSQGESIVTGAGELKAKESDRLSGINSLINNIGGKIKMFEDGFVITGIDKYQGGFIKTNDDHRIAMSGVIALMASKCGGEIDNSECVEISFPQFFDVLNENKLALIGGDVSQSKSPQIHAFLMDKLQLDTYSYTLKSFNKESIKENLQRLKGYKGYNVTIPHKQEILNYGIKPMLTTKITKGVNLVVGNKGYSTDGLGFMYMLHYNNISVENKKVLVLGCGGSGKSIIYQLYQEKAQIDVYSRTVETIIQLKKSLPNIYILREVPKTEYDIIINTTPIGSGQTIGQAVIKSSVIKQAKVVIDIIYNPPLTKLLKVAKTNEIKYLNGLDMLFFQAYISQAIIFNRNHSVQEAMALYNKFLKDDLWNT